MKWNTPTDGLDTTEGPRRRAAARDSQWYRKQASRVSDRWVRDPRWWRPGHWTFDVAKALSIAPPLALMTWAQYGWLAALLFLAIWIPAAALLAAAARRSRAFEIAVAIALTAVSIAFLITFIT